MHVLLHPRWQPETVKGHQVKNKGNTGSGGMGGKVEGLRNTNWQLQTRQGTLTASIRNGVAKERTCMTHGHEQRSGDHQREWGCWVEGSKGGKIRTTVIA